MSPRALFRCSICQTYYLYHADLNNHLQHHIKTEQRQNASSGSSTTIQVEMTTVHSHSQTKIVEMEVTPTEITETTVEGSESKETKDTSSQRTDYRLTRIISARTVTETTVEGSEFKETDGTLPPVTDCRLTRIQPATKVSEMTDAKPESGCIDGCCLPCKCM